MTATHKNTQIYLVPGFFGFTQLGAYSYFHQVCETLRKHLAREGIDAQLIEVETLPTGSIRRRARKLIEVVRASGGLACEHLHFIGHSAGGLDIRLMLSPNVTLFESEVELEAKIVKKTRSAITLSTPHYGTPMANFFTSMNGQNLLLLLCLMATSKPGRYGLHYLSRMIRMLSKADKWVGQSSDIIDDLSKRLLSYLTPAQGDQVWAYLHKIKTDQGAMVQLTPEAMDLFNGAVINNPKVDYFSFITASPEPSLKKLVPQFNQVYRSVTHLIYLICYQITKRKHPHYPYPTPSNPQALNLMRQALPFVLNAQTNDGIVPTLSQHWGRVSGVYVADHMDVVGQFEHIYQGQPYNTWLMSGSEFNLQRFKQIWCEIGNTVIKCQNSANNKV